MLKLNEFALYSNIIKFVKQTNISLIDIIGSRAFIKLTLSWCSLDNNIVPAKIMQNIKYGTGTKLIEVLELNTLLTALELKSQVSVKGLYVWLVSHPVMQSSYLMSKSPFEQLEQTVPVHYWQLITLHVKHIFPFK